VVPSIEAVTKRYPMLQRSYGFACSFNPTFSASRSEGAGWVSPAHYAINQGPVALMIENFRSDLIWGLFRRCPYVVEGLRRAGFQGGWLESAKLRPVRPPVSP
jgi:hypothetical protein